MRQNKFKKIKLFNQDEYSCYINENASAMNRAQSERFISHMQICTTFGPCALISGIILLAFRCDCIICFFSANGTKCLPWIFAYAIIVFGSILLILARVILYRLIVFNKRLYKVLKRKEELQKQLQKSKP